MKIFEVFLIWVVKMFCFELFRLKILKFFVVVGVEKEDLGVLMFLLFVIFEIFFLNVFGDMECIFLVGIC